MKAKSYAVIGLGRFGTETAVRLYANGAEVLVIDSDESLVDKIADRVTRAVCADARDADVLERLGVGNFDYGIVAIGTDLGASALITMNLKTLKVPYVICKAQNATHKEILERLGADRVIIPEREMANKLVLGLTSTGVMEYIELSEEYGIVERQVPEKWLGKSIRALDVRNRYGVNIIAVRREEDIRIPPDIDTPLDPESRLVILGSYDTLNQL